MTETINVPFTLSWMKQFRNLKTPHGLTGFYLPDDGYNSTQQQWESIQWNPPTHFHLFHRNWGLWYDKLDPNADPKPTWETMVEANKLQQIFNKTENNSRLLNENNYRSDLSDASVLNIDGNTFFVGEGLTAMASLAHMVEHANTAGVHLPKITMRDGDHAEVNIFTQNEVRKILSETAQRENIIESAHNIIINRYNNFIAVAQDESETTENRFTAFTQTKNIVDNYNDLLDKEIENFDPNTLPTDLPSRKAVYIERVEAAANSRIKWFKGVLTQQGQDLDPSCDDEANAIRKVVVASRNGSLAIRDAETIAEAKTAYDDTLTKINTVEVLNTPLWSIGETDYPANPVEVINYSGPSLTIKAKHPVALQENPDITNVSVRLLSAAKRVEDGPAEAVPVTTTSMSDAFKATTVTYTPTGLTSGDTVDFKLEARNLCGPSKIQVALTIP